MAPVNDSGSAADELALRPAVASQAVLLLQEATDDESRNATILRGAINLFMSGQNDDPCLPQIQSEQRDTSTNPRHPTCVDRRL